VTTSCDLAETALATVEDDDRGRVELYADAGRDDILLGATAVGPYAEEWMGEVTLAIRARIPLAVLADVVHAFPTYGEAVGSPLRGLAQRAAAGQAGTGQATGERVTPGDGHPAAGAGPVAGPDGPADPGPVPETAGAPGQADGS
jgi:dihydrolipoamide dehydrogenase